MPDKLSSVLSSIAAHARQVLDNEGFTSISIRVIAEKDGETITQAARLVGRIAG